MKRVVRRISTKFPSTLFKVACVISLVVFILYLRNQNDSFQKAERFRDVTEVAKISNTYADSYLQLHGGDQEFIAGILVICATRADALNNHLEQLVRQRPSASQYPIVISQDGNRTSVFNVADKFAKMYSNVTHVLHDRIEVKKHNNYPAISAHYKWALDTVFMTMNFSHLIVTEDDLDIGNDFYSYFDWAKRVLNADDTLWCVSAWNDNGASNLIDSKSGDLLWRTDFFPGLGWMLKREIWDELSTKFPSSYWDDWMRTPEIRKNRSCVRPEISRTSHNMKLAGKGSSGGMYKDYLSKIAASHSNVDFSLLPTSIVEKSVYDEHLVKEIKNAKAIVGNISSEMIFQPSYTYKVPYRSVRDWYNLARIFKLMTDIRGGMQRTAYHGIVTVMYKFARIYLVPENTYHNPSSFADYKYDPEWDKQYRFIEFERFYCKSKKYTGKCDPHSPAMIAFFKRKGWKKRLEDWGEMIVV